MLPSIYPIPLIPIVYACRTLSLFYLKLDLIKERLLELSLPQHEEQKANILETSLTFNRRE